MESTKSNTFCKPWMVFGSEIIIDGTHVAKNPASWAI